ncbi:cupin-like domain-containing protein [Marinimicrobium sp. LS-A18]|uniref:cupin-like domain-containing protein n=1 Tax=Marinimicrobium sp. LS-A18 TaxID=1381596 RepID=UPI0004678417|nr:cupin-like domain-containing protein [Marinimicrobium sp. LS-A18]
MQNVQRCVRTIEYSSGESVDFQALVEAGSPVILKGYVRSWPLIQAGLRSSDDAMAYLDSYAIEKTLTCYVGDSDMDGRFAYNSDITAFNFRSEQISVSEFFRRLKIESREGGDHLYIGSTTLERYFPGLRENNDINFSDPTLQESPPLVSIWMGNRTIASAHYDLANNIACCVAGRRRFTLFPPEQVANLYPGPLEPTPGGQVVSMVDFKQPDFERFPNFAKALEVAQVAELEPGDALVYPSMWWHHVEGLDDFNVLINYWWNPTPAYIDTPQNTLLHAMLALRERPDYEKQAWRELFDYYVFGDPELPRAHLPEHAQGPLGPLDETTARRLRARLMSKFNR